MYIDPSKTRSMEQEVNEATAKLKGLLGIGANSGAEGGGDVKQKNTETGQGGGKPPKSKRNRNKNKQNSRQRAGRDSKDAVQQSQQQPQQQQPQQNSSKPKPPQGNPQKESNKVDGNKKNNKAKKNAKRNAKDKDNQKQSSGKNTDKDAKNNFAWSAFQSSPDASKLPIPAFSPFANPKSEVAVSTEAVEEHAENALASLLPVGTTSNNETAPDLENVPKAEDLEEAAISAAKKEIMPGEDGTKIADEEEPESGPPPSKTGINLAALTSAGAADVSASPKLSGASGTAPPMSVTSTPQLEQPHVTQSAMTQHHQPPPHMNYQYHPHHHNPYHHMNPHPHAYHAPPPGYMTIQVQVPPVLMPGRQMVVQSPAGYPVQVVVPNGIPPGMVIPVHVPAGPPLHMMPPQQQQQYQHYQQQQAHQQQQQRYYKRGGT